MTQRVALITLLLASLALAAEPATRPAEASVPVAAVWFEISYPPPDVTLTKRLITGVWSDGTIVTSGDRTKGGPPYASRKIDPARVKKLVDELEAIGFFTDAELNKQPNRYPPDASYTAVAASSVEKRQRLALWRAPTTRPADADRFVDVFIEARRLIEQLGEAKGEPVEEIDRNIFNVGRKPR